MMTILSIDDSELKTLCESRDLKQLSAVLNDFLRRNEGVCDFTTLDESKLVSLWAAVFQLIENDDFIEIHSQCLTVLKILSRDRKNIDKVICEKYIAKLIEKAGYLSFLEGKDTSIIIEDNNNQVVTAESVKCLCNIAFISESGRDMCAINDLVKGLMTRIKVFKQESYRKIVMLYDVKLLFILTIMKEQLKKFVADELQGLDSLTDCLQNMVDVSVKNKTDDGAIYTSYVINDIELLIVCDIMKTQFTLFTKAGAEEDSCHGDKKDYRKLTSILLSLLYGKPSSEEKLMDLRSNIVNLLTVIPPNSYIYLTPMEAGTSSVHYMDHNVYGLCAILQYLEHQLNITTIKDQYKHLAPVLKFLTEASTHNRIQRKYLRSVVLPPLRDVSSPPERGSTLRNLLCRLLTTPITPIRDIVAGFLFVLCKEKVSRMVKYTGFGNAAGHLAQRGLLGATRPGDYSSSSDSDTEEYLEAQPRIDPVVGCTRPPRTDPFEGMSEEQKEYEAMKLVNMFDKLVSEGIVRPARLGPDGRPEPVEHVLQLQDTTNHEFK